MITGAHNDLQGETSRGIIFPFRNENDALCLTNNKHRQLLRKCARGKNYWVCTMTLNLRVPLLHGVYLYDAKYRCVCF